MMRINMYGLETSWHRASKYNLVETRPAEVALCRKWIEENARIRKCLNRTKCSYTLKHYVERDLGGYVTNGAFIAAAQELGFKVVRCSTDSPNAYFNMSFQKGKGSKRIY